MINKVIHYIWLGGKPMPKIFKKCYKSWKKYCPDFEIKRWDESNLDLEKYQFVKDALKAGKYAFASDVFRTEIIYNEGGVYLDIDVEILKPIDDLLENKCIMGFESSKLINPGLILASEPKNQDLVNLLQKYQEIKFDINNLDNITICKLFTEYFESKGLKSDNTTQKIDGTIFYDSQYFSPKSQSDGVITKTQKTYMVHHFNASWFSPLKKLYINIKMLIKRILGKKITAKIENRKKKSK